MCCGDDKNKIREENYSKGMIIGGMIVVASMMAVCIWKKMKFRNLQKTIQEFEMEQMNAQKSGFDEQLHKVNEEMARDDEEIELKEKVEKFNSRRLTKENESE
ncbi:hypothetical protein [Intestinibacter sp.]